MSIGVFNVIASERARAWEARESQSQRGRIISVVGKCLTLFIDSQGCRHIVLIYDFVFRFPKGENSKNINGEKEQRRFKWRVFQYFPIWKKNSDYIRRVRSTDIPSTICFSCPFFLLCSEEHWFLNRCTVFLLDDTFFYTRAIADNYLWRYSHH